MKKLLASFIAIYSAVMMIGCSKDGGSKNNTTVYPTCAAGTVWNGAACVVNGGSNVVTTTVQYGDYNYYMIDPSMRGNLSIVNAAAYETFLKEAMAVCDRTIWGWDIGLADCSKWSSGSFMISFAVDSSLKPAVRFEAYPAPNWYYMTGNIGIQTGGMAFNPLVLTGNNTFNLVNSSQGFEIRAQGSMYNGGGLRLIQIIVNSGNLTQNEFNYELWYPYNNVATKIATGKFKRY